MQIRRIFLFLFMVLILQTLFSCKYFQGPSGADGQTQTDNAIVNFQINNKNTSQSLRTTKFTMTWQVLPDGLFKYFEIDTNGDGNPDITPVNTNYYAGTLPKGSYSIRVRSINKEGAVGAWSAPIALTIDYSLVQNILVEGKTSPGFFNKAAVGTYNMSWGVLTDTVINHYEVDQYGTGTINASPTSPNYTCTYSSEGIYNLKIRAVDQDNNVGDWVTYTLYVDRVGPTTPGSFAVGGGSLVGTVNWTQSSDTLGTVNTGIRKYNIAITLSGNTAVISVYQSGGTLTSISITSDPANLLDSANPPAIDTSTGTYLIHFKVNASNTYNIVMDAQDNAGNLSTATSSYPQGL